ATGLCCPVAAIWSDTLDACGVIDGSNGAASGGPEGLDFAYLPVVGLHTRWRSAWLPPCSSIARAACIKSTSMLRSFARSWSRVSTRKRSARSSAWTSIPCTDTSRSQGWQRYSGTRTTHGHGRWSMTKRKRDGTVTVRQPGSGRALYRDPLVGWRWGPNRKATPMSAEDAAVMAERLGGVVCIDGVPQGTEKPKRPQMPKGKA